MMIVNLFIKRHYDSPLIKTWFPFCYTLQETKISEQHSSSNSEGVGVHGKNVGIQDTPLGKDQKSDKVLQKSGSSDSENDNIKKYGINKISDSTANREPYEGHRNKKNGENTGEKENFDLINTGESSAKFGKSKKEPEVNVQPDISYAGVASGRNQIPDCNQVDGGAVEFSKPLTRRQTDSS